MINPQTIKTALTSATSLLNTEESAFEAQLLLQHALNVNRAWLIAHENDALEPSDHVVFEALLKRRLNGEPIAYILGYREFYGLKLKVTSDTLIPRPDTETLVETALNTIPTNSAYKISDLGTGTGAIALAIAKHRPASHVTAVDFSEDALKIAGENAQNLALQNVSFVQSDWFSNLANRTFDLIVSNPPYIESDDAHLKQGDLRFEPLSALASGKGGLDDIRRIVTHAPEHLNAGGWLMFEHGYNQAALVRALLSNAGFTHIATLQDLGGNDRVTLGQRTLF